MRNGKDTSTVLANAFAIDAAASYMQLCLSAKKYRVEKALQHTCVLKQKVCDSGGYYDLIDLYFLRNTQV